MDTQKTITIDLVTAEKRNKKNQPFISVKDGDAWWYVGEKKLFPFFKKGEKIVCIVNTENDFKKIVDVISDEMGVHATPKQSDRQSTPNTERSGEAMKLLREIHQMLTDLTKKKPF